MMRGVMRAQAEIQQKHRMRREMKTDTENFTSIAQHSIAYTTLCQIYLLAFLLFTSAPADAPLLIVLPTPPPAPPPVEYLPASGKTCTP